MSEVERSPGGSPLGKVAQFIMKQTAKVRDKCLVNTKKKQMAATHIEPEVLEQNNSNTIKERKSQNDNGDIFLVGGGGADGSGDAKLSTNGTRGATLREAITGKVKAASGVDYDGARQKVRSNIYEAAPRGPVRMHTDPPVLQARNKFTDNKAEPKRTAISMGGESQSRWISPNHRPPTPKVKKSSQLRKHLKHQATPDPAQPNEDNQVTPTNKTKTVTPATLRPTVLTRKQRKQCAYPVLPDQLLHPLWRRIPHRPLYGWSAKHALLEELLRKDIADHPERSFATLYYNSEEEYKLAETTSGATFLSKPLVTTVEETIALLHSYASKPYDLPPVKPSQPWSMSEKHSTAEDDDQVESGYDGDSE